MALNFFTNYNARGPSPSPLNVSLSRILLGLYAIWKLLSYGFGRLGDWPAFLFERHTHRGFLPDPDLLVWLSFELAVTVGLLFLFVAGWRIRVVSFAAALLITHLGALHYVVSNSGTTLLPLVYALLLFGLFSDEDVLSADAWRVLGREPAEKLCARLGDTSAAWYETETLRWILLILAATYFLTGYSKLSTAGLDWASADNLALMFQHEALLHLDALPVVGRLIIDNPWLATGSVWATLFLECGFLVAVVLRLPITPFIIGLAGLHTMIYLSMNILFFDQYIIYLLFVPWDKIHARCASREPLRVSFDPKDLRGLRWLVIAQRLDLHRSIHFTKTPEPSSALVNQSQTGSLVESQAVQALVRQVGLGWILRERSARRAESPSLSVLKTGPPRKH